MKHRRQWESVRKWIVALLLIWGMQSTVVLEAKSIAFDEHATDVIYNSLVDQPDKSYLKQFYKRLLFLPVWMHEKGLSAPAKALFSTMKDDGTLDPQSRLYKDMHILEETAYRLYRTPSSFLQKMEMEFRISLLYKAYVDYAYFGSINWGAFQARIANLKVNDVSTEWELYRPTVDAAAMAEKAMMGADLGKMLQDAVPKAYHYRALQRALVRYIQIEAQGGWQRVYLDRTLRPGMRSEGVYALRERLKVTGEYRNETVEEESDLYDAPLQEAVKRFQERHGLTADGVVGPATLRAINVPVSSRITTIRLNLDRIKWLNPRQPYRHIIINIPFFMLYFEEDGRLIQQMRVITGKPNHPTPIFSDEVEMIVLNPYWNIPMSIIQKEMIPKLLRDPYSLKRKGIEIFSGWGKNAKPIDPASVDWAQYRYSKSVPYRFAQLPGKRNALGKIKFLFPNRFSVYMHDTPTKPLFKRDKRAFSHGCVRLQKPVALLETFSTFEPDIDFARSEEILEGKKSVYLKLKQKVPVDIIYLTAWVDYDGVLQFRDDIYHYDRMQLQSYKKW